jgi:hypothetical protein
MVDAADREPVERDVADELVERRPTASNEP